MVAIHQVMAEGCQLPDAVAEVVNVTVQCIQLLCQGLWQMIHPSLLYEIMSVIHDSRMEPFV